MGAFEEYVERYARENKISQEEALTHAVVREVDDYYKNAEKGKISVTEVSVGCGCDDDKSC